MWVAIGTRLTGGRESTDRTAIDKVVITLFYIAEALTFTGIIYFAYKTGKEINLIFNPPNDLALALLNRRQTVIIAVSCILTVAFGITGAKLLTVIPGIKAAFEVILIVSSVIPLAIIPVNLFLMKWQQKKWENKKVADTIQFYLRHREQAEKTSLAKQKILNLLILLGDIYTCFLCLTASLLALSLPVLPDTAIALPAFFAPAIIFGSSLYRIRWTKGKSIVSGIKTYLLDTEYPALYELTRRAADEMGCKGEIKISVSPGCNGGNARIGGTYSVILGAILLNLFSEDEIYAILLHEFSHMASINAESVKFMQYNSHILAESQPDYAISSKLTELFFGYLDFTYAFEYSVYYYSVSVMHETKADRAMLKCGNKKAVASSLLKIKYYDLFTWERGAYDEESLYRSEKPVVHLTKYEIKLFEEQKSQREDFWKSLAKVEILSRSSTHPTARMRLESLGLDEYETVENTKNPALAAECEKAADYLDEIIAADRKPSYADERREFYLEPKEKVDKWIEDGQPVSSEGYIEIVNSLRKLGRNLEAENLCDRAIATLPKPAAAYACFIKGNMLLRRYDKSGLEYMYKAMENQNFIHEGLSIVGSYCCYTGDETSLEIYRRKHVELQQKFQDEYRHTTSLNRGDRLSSENLPDRMLDDILSYIKSVDTGDIDEIYLVRKTITNNFFTSAFVVRFNRKANPDDKLEVMQKIYYHLDTCSDWQFSLFDYLDVKLVNLKKIKGSLVYKKEYMRSA